jgi:hypothetical protein
VLASVALTAEPSLDGVLNRVVRIAAEVIEAQYAAIGVLGPDGKTLESFTTRGIDDEARARLGSPPRAMGFSASSSGRPSRSGFPTSRNIRIPTDSHPTTRG